MNGCAYIFLDEAGNLDFSANGTRWFVLTSVSMRRPFTATGALDAYKHDCLEYGLNTEYFHCADDNNHVRGRVFDIITQSIGDFRIDSLVVEKPKTGPAMQADTRFYPEMLGYLLKYVVPKEIAAGATEVIVITDLIPVNKKRRAVEKGVQKALATMLPEGMRYRILHHSSRSHFGLQVADYCCWAVYRKWQSGEAAYHERIAGGMRSEFEIFKSGKVLYY
jgi:Protein of unknown function (DUF3800)